MTVHDPALQTARAAARRPGRSRGRRRADHRSRRDRGQLAEAARSTTVPAECAAVVKADAYGCGLEPVTGKLAKAGCRTFFVADLAEGAPRCARSRPKRTIYVLNGLLPGTAQAFAEVNLRPVINSLDRARRMGRLRRHRADWRGGAALHVDTGMNRLGVTVDEAAAHRAAHPVREPRHHAADEPSRLRRNARPSAQRPADPAVSRDPHRCSAASRPRSPIRPAFSSAAPAHCDLVRPGVALYGVNPTPGKPNPDAAGGRAARPASSRCATSSAARPSATARPGPPSAPTPHRDRRRRLRRRLSCAPAGAADAQAGGEAIVAGKRCPIVGRVSMDLIAVDVTDCPTARVRRGDLATLIGDGIERRRLAAACRHHRLRGADQPRPPLSPGLQGD